MIKISDLMRTFPLIRPNHEKFWKNLSIADVNKEVVPQDHPHRKLLIDKVLSFSPDSVLEVGCNHGVNLSLIAGKRPDIKAIGIDINPNAVQEGNNSFKHKGITNITLLEGNATDLTQFKSSSFDVVFTDATLIYIGKDKIMGVIGELIRVSRKGLVLVEWHDFENTGYDKGLGTRCKKEWKRDYVALLSRFYRKNQIEITKFDFNTFPDKTWSRYGAIIKVCYQNQENRLK